MTTERYGAKIDLIIEKGQTLSHTVYIHEKINLIDSIVQVSGTATVTLENHCFSTGDSVFIKGADQCSYNGIFEITVVTNDTFTFIITKTDETTPGTGAIYAARVVDLTDFSAEMDIREYEDSTSAILELTEDNSRITITETEGKIELNVDADDTAGLTAGTYAYDLKLISASGNTTYPIRGEMEIKETVTR